jgi:hypothetical protein
MVCFSGEDLNQHMKVRSRPTEMLDAEPTIKVLFNYPLNRPFTAEFTLDEGWTRQDFYNAVQAKYVEIYKEERETTSTDGKFGIWGHDLGDLVLETAEKVEGVWHLGVGS